ncbi:MAG: T9SS type A sorting domain-containing protein [Armatimonadetes bacterium]|nr:T9SS type A sorting domain-containing protein [Armatimonadota bacterium]
MTYDLAVQDNLAFVACWWDGMRIINFEDPASPYQTGHVLGWYNGAIPGEEYCFVQAVDVQGDYAYIIDYGPFPDDDTFGLYIVDISNPANPFVVMRYTDFTSHGSDIDVEGDYAYIADSYGGVEVINIANPNAPSTVGYCGLIDSAQGIHVDGEYAYIANYILGGVQVLFIGNPQAPIPFGWYKRTGCFAMNVTSSENHIYVADGVAGIQIYKNLLIQVGSEDENIQIQKPQSWNYPNPFNPETTIYFEFNTENTEGTELIIYNLKGQEIRKYSIFREQSQAPYGAGNNQSSIVWDGKDEKNKSVSSGIYFYKIKSGYKSISRKMLLLK